MHHTADYCTPRTVAKGDNEMMTRCYGRVTNFRTRAEDVV